MSIFSVRVILCGLTLCGLAHFFVSCGSLPDRNSNTQNYATTSNSNVNAESNGGWTKLGYANNSDGGNHATRPNNSMKSATSTPGIPDPALLNKPLKPGATPTPGIPDPANIRKQLERRVTNAEVMVNTNRSPQMLNKKKQPGPAANRIQ